MGKNIRKQLICVMLSILMILGSGTVTVPAREAGETASPGGHYLKAYDRVLVRDDFANGDNWNVFTANTGSEITFAGNKATIKGSGVCNWMGYAAGIINANDFLIQLDVTPNEGNTNANTKIAFKGTDQYEGDRLQVRLLYPQNQIALERTKENDQTEFVVTWSETADFTFTQGRTYGVDILVKGNTAAVYIDGNSTPVLSVTNDDIADMAKGYFAVAGQYPKQDFSIENLVISTEEAQTGAQYQVKLEVSTNGKRGDGAGGTLTSDVTSGYNGDMVALTAVPAHGYVFDHFESYKEDGTSTDGLMPINHNRFQINEKFGNITVVACFQTREPGRFELFYDDFGKDSIDAGYKTIGTSDQVVLENGELTLNVSSGNNYLLLNQEKLDSLKQGEGYRIAVDMRKADDTAGTVHLMFKGADTTISNRYALVLNGEVALFRRILADGTNVELAKNSSFSFSTAKVHVELEVKENTITFFADGEKILSYTADEENSNWKGLGNAVGLVNMTVGAPVVFDNLLVERIVEKVGVTAKVMREENGTQTEDTEGISGTVALSAVNAVEGDTITFDIVEKAGYRLKECYVEDTSQGITITDSSFTVPGGITGNIKLVAVFEPTELRKAGSYYIDSGAGNDKNAGTMDAPWKSFAPLGNITLVPGDHIYLKRGSVFEGQQLCFRGMGTQKAPIVIDAYGDGQALPKLNGNGKVENVISLYNQEHIEICNLEITNTSPDYDSSFGLNTSNNKSQALRAINVSAKDFGTVSGIHIKNCYIHDINGNISLKWNGGIFFDVQAVVSGGGLAGIPTKYDDVLIEGCTFINVDRSGIKLVNSAWCNQWEPNNSSLPVNWYPSTNVVVRNNYMEKIGGDGITTRDTDGALIEYNLVKDCRYQNTSYNVGIWPFQASGTVIQYNEAYNTHSTTDGQGLDCDHASSYSLMQYNYSHNNEGGFMLIMGGYPHTAPTVRYNVSQNDCDKAFEFAQGIPNGTMIYNNTLYSKSVIPKGILFLSNSTAGLGVNEMFLFNNLFCYPEGQTFFYENGDSEKLMAAANLYNNAYVGGIAAPTQEKRPVTVADTDSVLVNAGSGPETNDTKVPKTGKSGLLNGYQLKENSALIDAGITITEAITYFGDGKAKVVDGRALSPRELYEQAKTASASIHYVMGENFPEIKGVRYDRDFFGNPALGGRKPDIGAAEYVK